MLGAARFRSPPPSSEFRLKRPENRCLLASAQNEVGVARSHPVTGFDGAANLVLLVAVIALGDSIRSRRELRQWVREEAERAAREHERAAGRQVE
jgi:hypothetical protein